jgi:hypothetical protein
VQALAGYTCAACNRPGRAKPPWIVMTEANEPEPWSVDPTLRFDSIHLIESLNTGFAGRSRRRLAEELQTLAAGGPVKVTYHAVAG